jgi:hypothetical protein
MDRVKALEALMKLQQMPEPERKNAFADTTLTDDAWKLALQKEHGISDENLKLQSLMQDPNSPLNVQGSEMPPSGFEGFDQAETSRMPPEEDARFKKARFLKLMQSMKR